MTRRQVLTEAGLVAVVGAFQVFTALAGDEHGGGLDLLAVALLLAGPLSLPLRHRAPWLTIGTAVAAGVAYFSLGYPGAAIFATVVVALVSLRRRRSAEEREAREQERARLLGEQRLELARELHDVLAHSISVIRVQAGVALHLIDERPDQVRGALQAITEASDQGMRELRAAVATLRREGEQAPLAPVGLDRLDDLVQAVRGPGLCVSVERDGRVRPLPPAVELTAYRVVQEALTNTVRHAGASRARVHLAYGERDLVVQVDDDGCRAPGPVAEGNGLSGMRERVHGVGGTVDAGPAGSGWAVRAVLPVGAAR